MKIYKQTMGVAIIALLMNRGNADMQQDNLNVIYTGKVLREKAIMVEDFSSKETREIIAQLITQANKGLNGQKAVGLAAPQIGISKQIFIYRLPVDDNGTLSYDVPWKVVFNPTYTGISEQELMKEGCLSIPYFYSESVPRYQEIEYEYMDDKGKIYKDKASGFFAHIFQHETDHLKGRLYIDLLDNYGQLKLVTDKPIRE